MLWWAGGDTILAPKIEEGTPLNKEKIVPISLFFFILQEHTGYEKKKKNFN